MDKNNSPYLLEEKKKTKENLDNIEKKISNGKSMKIKLDLIRNVLEENCTQVEENIHENFNKLRKFLNEREVLLIKKLNNYIQQHLVKIEKETNRINDKLDFLYSCQNHLEKNGKLSTEYYNLFCEEYESCLAIPRYQICIRENLNSEIKNCGILKPFDVLLLNIDSLNDDESIDINQAEYKFKNQSESEDIEIIDMSSVSSSLSSSLLLFPESEKIDNIYENEICSNHLPLDLVLHKNEEFNKKIKHKEFKVAKLNEDQILSNSTHNFNSLGKGIFFQLLQTPEERGKIDFIKSSPIDVSSPSDTILKSKTQNVNHTSFNEYQDEENEKKDASSTVLNFKNNYIFDFNARIKNILGNEETSKKECFAQKEIDMFCSKISIKS